MIINEKIKASEVQLLGVNGEELGIHPIKEALRLAKEQEVDLICLSLLSSPPPCQLIHRGDYKKMTDKQKQKDRKSERGVKIKEIRLNESIEDHDYETKRRQAEKKLISGDSVKLRVQSEGKKNDLARQRIEQLIKDLKHCGMQEKGIQVSGKQIMAILHPKM